jgi:hypothetical protein
MTDAYVQQCLALEESVQYFVGLSTARAVKHELTTTLHRALFLHAFKEHSLLVVMLSMCRVCTMCGVGISCVGHAAKRCNALLDLVIHHDTRIESLQIRMVILYFRELAACLINPSPRPNCTGGPS